MLLRTGRYFKLALKLVSLMGFVFLFVFLHFFLLQKMDLKEFSIGDIPIEILDIESKTENNDAKIDFVASYHGNALIKTQVDLLAGIMTEIPARVTNIELKETKMRILLEGFDPEYPFISKLKFAFIEDPIPNFSWDIHNLAGIAEIPWFEELVISVIKKMIRKKTLLPAMITCWNFKKEKAGEDSDDLEEQKLPQSSKSPLKKLKKRLKKKNKKRNTIG